MCRNVRSFLTRLCRFAVLLLLLLSAVSLSASAAEQDVMQSELYGYDFDEKAGEVAILLDIDDAADGKVDLLPIMRDAAAKGANVLVDTSAVKIYFRKEAVAEYAACGGRMPLSLKKYSDAEELPSEIPFGESVCALRISYDEGLEIAPGDTLDVGKQDVMIRCRFKTAAADNIRTVVYRDDGSEVEALKCGFESGGVYFYPGTLSADLLYCILDSALPPSTPKLPFLLCLVLGVLLLLSAAVLVLLKTGKVKRWYLSRR